MLSFWQLWLRSQVKGHLQMWVGALGCYALRCLVIAYNEASNCINFINKTVLKCGTCIIWIWWDILISVGDWCGSLNLLSVKTDVLGILMLQLFHVCTKIFILKNNFTLKNFKLIYCWYILYLIWLTGACVHCITWLYHTCVGSGDSAVCPGHTSPRGPSDRNQFYMLQGTTSLAHLQTW